MSTTNALFSILEEQIRQETLVLPTLPEIALKVRGAADDADVNLNHMSDVISQDPALSMGMIKVANSVAFGRAVKVTTINQAVTRIGLRQIKSIATAMALEQVFVSNNEIIAMYMKKSWNKTIDVASVAIALMTKYLETHKQNNRLTLDTLTLAALVHNLGVLPILTEAEHHQDIFANPTFLQEAIGKLASKIGSAITKAWGFSDEFTDIVENWNDLSVLPKEASYIDFIRAGAIFHEVFKSESTRDVLLKSYVQKGILPDEAYMQSAEFLELVKNTKTMFC
jgi:HD-like signal output (HDOD) protein